MRNILKKTAFLIFALASLFVMSCTEVAVEREEKSSAETGTLIFSGSDVARSVGPTFSEDLAEFKKVTLLGSYGSEAEKTLGTWDTMAAFKAAQVDGVKIGSWVLTLKAETLATGGALYSDIQTVTVKGGTNAVTFNLSRKSWGTGNGTIAIDITLASTAATNVKGAEVLVDGTAVSATLSSSKISYTDNTKAGGQYEVTVKFYGDTGKKLFLNSMTNVVNVGAGLITTWSETISDVNAIYQITYNANEGTMPGSYQTYYTINSGVSSLPRPTKSGYLFKGWFDNAGLSGAEVTSIATGSTGNKTLYAKWEEYVAPTITAWDFTSWSAETKANVEAAPTEWEKKANDDPRYTKALTDIAEANGVVIKELEGLLFKGSVTISYTDTKGKYIQTGAEITVPVEESSKVTITLTNTGTNNQRKLTIVEGTKETEFNTTKGTKDQTIIEYTVGSGTTSITLKPEGALNFYSIKGPVHATGISLAVDGANSIEMKIGNAKTITPTFTPSDAIEKSEPITWVSSNPSVVSVDSNGVLTPLLESSTAVTITARTSNGKEATFTVTKVRDSIKPDSVSISCGGSKTIDKLAVGSSKTISWSFTPTNTEATALTWTSTSSAVSVSNGVVTGVSAGTNITITARTVNGKTDSITISEVVDPSAVTDSIVFKDEGGWLESAFAEWYPVSNGTVDGYNAYVKSTSASSWTKLDKELIRGYSNTAGGSTVNYYRVDALGLKAGTYQIKVVGKTGDTELSVEGVTGNIAVAAHTREGFAFMDGHVPGAYKMDGTLKDNAVIVYVTNENKNTVTVALNTEGKGNVDCTGLQNIILGYKKGKETRPISIRLIGNITDPAVLSKGDIYLDTVTTGGMTLEGVGEDAVANGWGIVLKNCVGVEVRNIASMNVNSEEGDDFGLQQKNSYTWVHNCDMFYGDAGSDKDQVKGDGALDTKDSHHITHTYNHFWDSGKCNLQGGTSGDTSDLITYHHNWYDHSDSRHPRVRNAQVHVYNNYYDGNSKYGIGAALTSNIFVENNYFRACQYPMLISMQGNDLYAGSTTTRDPNNKTFSSEDGGFIKAYGNYMTGNCSFIPYGASTILLKGTEVSKGSIDTNVDFDAYVASTRNEQVPNNIASYEGGNKYSNFDTNSSIMYSYTPDSPEVAKEKVLRYAGRMRRGDISTASLYFDLSNYTPNGFGSASAAANPDKDYFVINALKTMLTNYQGNLAWTNVDGSSTGGGSDPDPNPDPTTPTITLNPTTMTLTAGGATGTITATASNGATITWTSSTPSVATVSNGVVTPLTAGTTTITASATGATPKTCAVTVNESGGGGNTGGGGSDSTTWLAKETAPSWLSGVPTTSPKSSTDYGVFGGIMKANGECSGGLQLSADSTFTVALPSGYTKITVYIAADATSDKSGVVAKVGETQVGSTYTMPNRKTGTGGPMVVTVTAGSTVTFTNTSAALLAKIVIE